MSVLSQFEQFQKDTLEKERNSCLSALASVPDIKSLLKSVFIAGYAAALEDSYGVHAELQKTFEGEAAEFFGAVLDKTCSSSAT